MSKIMTGKNIECQSCGKIFYAPAWEIKRGKKFCSSICKGAWLSTQTGEKSLGWRGGGVAVQCGICKKEFFTSPSRIKQGKGKFCSKVCHIEHQKTLIGDKSLKWNGGHVNVHGYKVSVNGVKEHRLVMEQYLGRKLEQWEHIHHINENKLDNRLENLELVTNSEHRQKHIHYHIIDGKKECSTCHKMLSLLEYSKDSNNSNGYRYACKSCHNIYRKKLQHGTIS